MNALWYFQIKQFDLKRYKIIFRDNWLDIDSKMAFGR